MGEATIYKQSIYKGNGVYNNGAGGGGGGNVELSVKILNKWYRVIKANDLYWLAEDLRELFNGITIDGSASGPSMRVYGGDTINFLAFGGLYTWHCKQIIQNYLDANNNGWRIPSTDDFIKLFDSVGGQNKCGLKLQKNKESLYNWWNSNSPTDEIGFSKGGSGFYENGSYSIRAVGYAWTSNENNSTTAKMAAFRDNDKHVPFENESKNRFLSIRLCKDA